jgi:two-component system chemotaxis sensor kinase CheA
VEVIDDGRGIDPTAVRGKARERAIGLGEQELAAMSDEQVVELIFGAGFSFVTPAQLSCTQEKRDP